MTRSDRLGSALPINLDPAKALQQGLCGQRDLADGVRRGIMGL